MSEREDEARDEQETLAKKPRLNLTTSQVAASALAACSASVVASYLGVAGTVIGAAVGSVVATTGAAIWGHVFRTGGHKIKQTLLVNGEFIEVEVDEEAAGGETAEESDATAKVPAGRFYGANAAEPWTPKEATAETRVIREDTKLILPPGIDAERTQLIAPAEAAEKPSRLARILRYRKPMGIAAAIVAVFSVAIVVGIFAGAPVRSAGSSTTPSTTTTTTVTETTHGAANDGSSASADSTGSKSSGATASSSASSSNSATSSASPSTSPSAAGSTKSTGTASGSPQAGGATSTGSP
ncbi:hypothetical protein [Actinospica sp.]|jgi:hypothetical protein|uniref:hypothetical protein n=1 Tax=Actinospica sp. TaxID=1872142 RepID=UPI002C20DD13|nr:hypothetical protein [Actinospica sp.]HWG23812.1 hypothetical protein [Actinospica sp.]